MRFTELLNIKGKLLYRLSGIVFLNVGPNRRQYVQTSISPADMQRALQLNLI